MKLADRLIDRKDTTQLHIEPIKCYGCKEEYSVTVGDDPFDYGKKYCATCFGNVYGLNTYENIMRQFDPLRRMAWEIPTHKLPEQVRKHFHRERKSK